jgi:Rieske Fe-S protein
MKHSTVLFFIIFGLNACNNTQDEPMPYAYVNLQISLLDQAYAIPLDKGYRYLSGVGTKGILLYRESSTSYIAFERCCTHKPSDRCAVEVDSSQLFIKDRCCNSFFKFDGSPFSGPAYRPLLRYNTTIAGNTLYITN